MTHSKRLTVGLLLASITSATAFEGGQGHGNGGQYAASEFVKRAQHWIRAARAQNVGEIDGVAIADLEKHVGEMKVFSCEKAYLNSSAPCVKKGPNAVERAAVNFPKAHEIYVNESQWEKQSQNQRDETIADVFGHEIFGLMSLEKSGQYAKSSRFVSALKVILEKHARESFYQNVIEDQTWAFDAALKEKYLGANGALLKRLMHDSINRLQPPAFSSVTEKSRVQVAREKTPGALRALDAREFPNQSKAKTLPDFTADIALVAIEQSNGAFSSWEERLEWKERLKEAVRINLISDAVKYSLESTSAEFDPSDNPYAQYFGDREGIFARASRPSTESLAMNQIWYCNSFSAVPGIPFGDQIGTNANGLMSKSLPWYRFTNSNDGLYVNSGLSHVPAVVSLEQYQSIAGAQDNHGTSIVDYVRVTESGSLVGETSVSRRSPLFQESGLRSQANPNRMVVAFHHCSSEKRRTQSPTLAALEILKTKGALEFYEYAKNRQIGQCRMRVETTKVEELHLSVSGGMGTILSPFHEKEVKNVLSKTTFEIILQGLTVYWKPLTDNTLLGRIARYYYDGYLEKIAGVKLSPDEKVKPDGLSIEKTRAVNELARLLSTGACEVDPNDRTILTTLKERSAGANP